jgi:FdhD protein
LLRRITGFGPLAKEEETERVRNWGKIHLKSKSPPLLAKPRPQHQYRPMKEFALRPDPDDPRLTRAVEGIDHEGRAVRTSVVVERPLTLFLNGQEIVTMMTVGDHPDYLAVGYLLNQNMLRADDVVTGIDYDEELATVVVRTKRRTDYERKLRKKTLTSGCAQGTVFGDLMEKFEEIALPPDAVLRTSWLYTLTRKINTSPSLYLAAGAIHGCVLCEEDRPLVYMEDVGRHNAIDKIAGFMHLGHIGPEGKIFYTTGRLTSEMVIKCVQMRIPILISRSGFTAWGVELAKKAGLTLIGRAKGKRFVALAGEARIVFDADGAAAPEESERLQRKASLAEDDA